MKNLKLTAIRGTLVCRVSNYVAGGPLQWYLRGTVEVSSSDIDSRQIR